MAGASNGSVPCGRQSEHFADYFRALERLEALGLLYPCACTRADIARAALKDSPRDPDGAPLIRNLPEQAAPADPRDFAHGGSCVAAGYGEGA